MINDKLQGSVATYLRCGGVVNNQIKKVSRNECAENYNIWHTKFLPRDAMRY